ncbi:hypothetical protein Tco_0728634 [Tanacetum coccineum]|uniref:MAK10-like protein n=1 Tax=Tanacetum coccineum TaxID=301880 RepID=A0ABQ4YPR7_9ASTR
MGNENPIRTLGDYSRPSHEGYQNTIELPNGNNVVPLRSDTIRTSKLRNDILMFQQHHGESLSEAWTHFKDLLQKKSLIRSIILGNPSPNLYMTISIPPQGKSSISRPVMEAHLALKSPIQVNKIAFSCEICSGPHNTQYCMENLEQAFVEYASSRTNEAGGIVKPDTKDNDHDTIVKVEEESKVLEEEGKEENDDP